MLSLLWLNQKARRINAWANERLGQRHARQTEAAFRCWRFNLLCQASRRGKREVRRHVTARCDLRPSPSPGNIASATVHRRSLSHSRAQAIAQFDLRAPPVPVPAPSAPPRPHGGDPNARRYASPCAPLKHRPGPTGAHSHANAPQRRPLAIHRGPLVARALQDVPLPDQSFQRFER